ncbi:hypothetical protein [Flavobacterium sp.]|uniref:hypothetical protein n=1 Tax=Flavobacterium sp. TaxID=239 RepID=UPI003D6AC112
MEYKLKRKCADCGHVDFIFLTKIEAAFELYDTNEIWKSLCSKCHSEKCNSLIHAHPKLDEEILNIWGYDSNLFLMEQDEELFLAEIDYLDMILEKIDDASYLKAKIDILIEAVCILLYDNTFADDNYDDYSDAENKQRKEIADFVRPQLYKRKEKIKKAENSIMEYIKAEVFPQVGLELD